MPSLAYQYEEREAFINFLMDNDLMLSTAKTYSANICNRNATSFEAAVTWWCKFTDKALPTVDKTKAFGFSRKTTGINSLKTSNHGVEHDGEIGDSEEISALNLAQLQIDNLQEENQKLMEKVIALQMEKSELDFQIKGWMNDMDGQVIATQKLQDQLDYALELGEKATLNASKSLDILDTFRDALEEIADALCMDIPRKLQLKVVQAIIDRVFE